MSLTTFWLLAKWVFTKSISHLFYITSVQNAPFIERASPRTLHSKSFIKYGSLQVKSWKLLPSKKLGLNISTHMEGYSQHLGTSTLLRHHFASLAAGHRAVSGRTGKMRRAILQFVACPGWNSGRFEFGSAIAAIANSIWLYNALYVWPKKSQSTWNSLVVRSLFLATLGSYVSYVATGLAIATGKTLATLCSCLDSWYPDGPARISYAHSLMSWKKFQKLDVSAKKSEMVTRQWLTFTFSPSWQGICSF